MRRWRVIPVTILLGLGLGAAVLLMQWADERKPGSRPLLGMARQTDIRIAPQTTGRLASVLVKPGQSVKRGALLAVIDNPELSASVAEAVVAAASARAERDRVFSGVRAERVASAGEAVKTAQANRALAEAHNMRITTLSGRGHASQQQLDESTASLAKAEAEVQLKQAQFAQASAGPVAEERELAQARVALAEAGVATLEAELAKTRLVAPADATVDVQVALPGEIMVPGRPVLILGGKADFWFSFTLREDLLRGIGLGADVALLTGDGRRLAGRVTELRPLGEFATWRAARAVGDHDLNSFRLRIEPSGTTDGIEPGMSVWLVDHQ